MSIYLERIAVRFPETNAGFTDGLASLLDGLGQSRNHRLNLGRSSRSIHPEILLDFRSVDPDIVADFTLSNDETISIKIENSTGLSRKSPHAYEPIPIDTVRQRLATSGIKLLGIDHAGINLPWFSSDLHPRIIQLREEIASRCLYHRFPTGEPWDFILPGEVEEIGNRKPLDYTVTRRPKFELVSFAKASTPLIQFDVGVNADYASFSLLFPEALSDPQFKNIWIYLENPYPIDVCLVINEFTASDWSNFFEGCRL